MSAEDLKEAAKDLPKSWEVFHSKKSNRLYYYNNVTKKTQWHHPSLGEKNKQDEKSKSKKRKAPSDEQNKVKSSDNKQSLKQKDEKNHELTNTFRIKKERANSNCVAETSKPPVKMFFKALPKLSFKLKTTKPLENTKSNAFFSKPCKETVKSNAQIFETHKESDKTNARTSNSAKTYPLGNKFSNQAIKSNLETVKTAEKSGKNNPKASDNSKEPKTPALLNNKVPSKTKKIPKLQPLLRTKSLGEGSDSGVSDSSDRILAWLADTSRIDFKDHPIPNINITENEIAKSKGEQDQTTVVKQKSGRNTAEKQNSDTSKIAILKRVETNFKHKSDALDEVLPKHSQTHGKKRYTPYQLTTPNLKHDKVKNSNNSGKAEQEKCLSVQTNAKTTAGQTVKTTTTNQNSLSYELTNSVAKKIGGKPTAGQNGFLVSETVVNKNSTTNSFGVNGNVSTNVGSVKNIDNTSRKNSLQDSVHEVQRLVDGETIQELGGVSDNVLQQDDVLSMEEGAGSSAVSIPLSDSDVADMDIDNAEEFAREIVKELKEMRNSLIVRPDQISSDQMAMKISSEGYEGTLYIVLDTNVLLSHLKFVIELKDFPIPGVGMPILVIPWVVIQELDSLKENKWKSHESGDKTTRVDILARHAIKFLNSSFQKSDPRVRGQTVSEAAEHVGTLQEETNDDRILQCCLLFHNKAQNGSCVLFSNDVNLCNKAMVNGIKAFNHEKLLPGLKDLFQCGAVVKQHSEEYNMQLAIEEDLSRRRQKADDIMCELQIILREGVSYIIESEMKKAYDDLWLEIVHIKPPWTLIDVLQLLDKHWIAVFGHILKRDKKQLIDKLRQKFDDRKGTASSLQFCSEMLQLALQLFQSFAYHSNYDDAMPKCLAAVNVLVQKCQQFQASVSTSSGAAQVKCLTYPSDPTTSKVSTIENNNQNHGEVVSSNQAVPHEEVMNTFNLIWTAVTQFSSQIFTALGYPNTITEGTTQDYPKASKEEAISFLRVLCPRLLNVVHCIQNVLRDPWERVSQNDSLFIQLEQAIAVFLKEVLSQENNATAEKLFKFCEDPSVRTSLVQGLSQLDRASAMLQHCASCVVQSSTMSS